MIYIKRWLEYYSDFFSIESKQVEFIENLAKDFNQPAKYLSVECGSGLLSEKLAEKFDVTAIDTNSEFISQINKRHSLGENSIHAFNLLPSDIGRYLGKDFFNVIGCFNYRLIFMKDKAQINKFMLDSKLLLQEGGYLILDLINFSKFDFSQTKIELPSRKCERGELYSSIIKDSENAKYKLYQQVITASGKVADVVKDEEISPISIETLKVFAKELKYSSIDFYNDYSGTPFTMDSDKIICILKK